MIFLSQLYLKYIKKYKVKKQFINKLVLFMYI